jgi:paraquat-inducible protein B
VSGRQDPHAAGKGRRLYRLVWVIPLIAVIVAGQIVVERVREWGPEITITFSDGGGLRVGQTPIKYRGVQIGEVIDVDLAADYKKVQVKARLKQSAAAIASEGAVFWIVRAQLAGADLSGLGTVLTGPEIQVLPGHGEQRKVFTGLDNPPVALEVPGIDVVLRAPRPKSLRANSPVYFRGVEVGVVSKIDLAPDAGGADIHLVIRKRYAGLVRSGSVFWNAGGASVSGGLLKGVTLEVESLRALLVGGIEFASPPHSPPMKPGAVFALHDAPRPEWLAWAPMVKLPAPD